LLTKKLWMAQTVSTGKTETARLTRQGRRLGRSDAGVFAFAQPLTTPPAVEEKRVVAPGEWVPGPLAANDGGPSDFGFAVERS
jgi:hypothetical protein